MKQKIVLLISLSFLLLSCHPAINIYVRNKTDDEICFQVKLKDPFSPTKSPSIYLNILDTIYPLKKIGPFGSSPYDQSVTNVEDIDVIDSLTYSISILSQNTMCYYAGNYLANVDYILLESLKGSDSIRFEEKCYSFRDKEKIGQAMEAKIHPFKFYVKGRYNLILDVE
ncbi:hypothetical protein R9C00_18810 [Flammeovirgaceae bacterium SG7u.111]|nr:hypothetical protein [Flammeovirgaceae bacterium SG7u.132]WPO33752.1 hypothetical protein R9C00_18810 [Flammeovirgaceae bacterium SG7u.111]